MQQSTYTSYYIQIVILSAILSIVEPRSMSLVDSVQRDMNFIKTCNKTSPMDLGSLNDILINHRIEPGRMNEFQCFLHCLYTKYGWMDEEGGFMIASMKRMLEDAFLDIITIDQLVYRCTYTSSTDKCERAFEFTKCAWKHSYEYQPMDDDNIKYNI